MKKISGKTNHDEEWWESFEVYTNPENLKHEEILYKLEDMGYDISGHYSHPGGTYSRAVRIRINRRRILVMQSGGLDV